MAFRLGDKLYKEILYGYAEDLTTTEVGTQTIDNVTLKAYDKDGNVVDVEFVPEKVKAEVTIESPSKEVSLNLLKSCNEPFINSLEISSVSRRTNNRSSFFGH